MKTNPSRRDFLSASVALPAAGLCGLSSRPEQTAPSDKTSPIKLEYRTLGKTGLKITTVGFGCMLTSDPSVITRAADLGINYFDTARVYQGGNNERMVGAALKARRKDIVLSTKVPSRTKDAALTDLETSLRELATDYVDIWYLHAKDDPSQINDDLLEAQRIAKQQGKIRFAGVSTHSGQQKVLPYLAPRGLVDVVLVAYNFTMTRGMTEAVEEAAKSGLGVVAMKVMAGGFRKTKPGDPLYDKLKTEGTMLAALKWAIRDSNVHTTVPSMTDMDQLDENLRAMREPFGSTDDKLLARQSEFIRPLYCRMCGECRGTCAKGLPVEDVLRYVTYAEGYGQFAVGREKFLALGSGMTAVRCGDCENCTVTCPHGVKVSDRLSRAQELFA